MFSLIGVYTVFFFSENTYLFLIFSMYYCSGIIAMLFVKDSCLQLHINLITNEKTILLPSFPLFFLFFSKTGHVRRTDYDMPKTALPICAKMRTNTRPSSK